MSDNLVISFRMDKGDAKLLKSVSKARREDVSDFIRRSIMKELCDLSFLPDFDKKALGKSGSTAKVEEPAHINQKGDEKLEK